MLKHELSPSESLPRDRLVVGLVRFWALRLISTDQTTNLHFPSPAFTFRYNTLLIMKRRLLSIAV